MNLQRVVWINQQNRTAQERSFNQRCEVSFILGMISLWTCSLHPSSTLTTHPSSHPPLFHRSKGGSGTSKKPRVQNDPTSASSETLIMSAHALETNLRSCGRMFVGNSTSPDILVEIVPWIADHSAFTTHLMTPCFPLVSWHQISGASK